MGFYNILYLLKKISFNFTNFLKYSCIFMILTLIIYSLFLLFSPRVSAETIDDLTNTINSAIDNIQEIQNGANWCVGLFDDGNYYMLTCASYGVGNNSFANYVQNNKNYIFCTDSTYRLSRRGGTNYYTLTTNGYTFYGEDNTNHRLNLNATSLYYSSVDVHYENSNSVFFQATEVAPSFVPPSFVNYEDSNWDGTLVNGEFNYFYIDGNSVDSVYLYFYDTTYGVGDDDSVVWGAILNDSSEYVLHDANGGIYWAFNKTIPFGGYKNSRDYKLVIQYFDNNNISHSLDYTWTTDFSQSVIDGEWDNGLADINKGVQDINSFLNDKNMDSSSILNGMPSNDVPDPTADSINNIFNMFRNVFSTENARDVVIEIPNTNEIITIPSNLVTSHIPQPILILVQSFYWFIICRFIVKDISKVVERAKSGEILDAQDGNIKTDLL